jgi:SAM-dependent methyltransferase
MDDRIPLPSEDHAMTSLATHVVPDPKTGDGVLCPCCGNRSASFLPFGLAGRPSAKCPYCGSKKRHRLLWLFLREQTDFFTRPMRVLHFAPERCFRKRFQKLPNLDYVTADLAPEKVKLVIDITAIPASAGSFDAILCSHVLEHVSDDRQAMRELYRVLKPGGWAAVMVPVDWDRARTLEDPSIVSPADRERVFGQHDHRRLYGRDVPERLESAEFAVVAHGARELGPGAALKYALSSKDRVYHCRKRG